MASGMDNIIRDLLQSINLRLGAIDLNTSALANAATMPPAVPATSTGGADWSLITAVLDSILLHVSNIDVQMGMSGGPGGPGPGPGPSPPSSVVWWPGFFWDFCIVKLTQIKEHLAAIQAGGMPSPTPPSPTPTPSKDKLEANPFPLLKEGLETLGSKINSIMTHGEGSTMLGKGADVLSGAGSTVASAGLETGSLLGMAAGGALSFAGAMLKSVDIVHKWGQSLLDTNFAMAEFSGSMATVSAEKMVRDILLTIEKGQAREGPTRDLAEAVSRLERAVAPIENAISNGFSWLAEKTTNIVTKSVQGWRMFFHDVFGIGDDPNKEIDQEELLKKARGTGASAGGAAEWMFSAGLGTPEQVFNRPGRLPGRRR
jgi:hypothetical protein